MLRSRLVCSALMCAMLLMVGFREVKAQSPNAAVQWNRTLLECVRRSRFGPPIVARAIGVTHTCGYDAWAAFDDRAIGTRFGEGFRRPPAERSEPNQIKAYSYSVYRALLDLFPGQDAFIRAEMLARGFDPDDGSLDPSTPAGVGNRCAAAVLELRHVDGSNQLGDRHLGAYTDYTAYQPVNTLDAIIDPNRWQPLRFSDGAGDTVAPGFIAPHWGNVTPFALNSGSEFRPQPPAMYPSRKYLEQAEVVIDFNRRLGDREKVIAEYWADGPRSELPPGHWQLFGEFVSLRDHHSFSEDVKMFFMLGNAVQDAGIACWEAKRFYDYVRPITAVHFLKGGQRIQATIPFLGVQEVDGADWRPYQPATFVTPPFAEYVSGHSTFSAAAAEVLRRFTGSDRFGSEVTIPAGSSKVEPGFAPSAPVTLSWKTFTEAADEAGISRLFGGIHFTDGDFEGRKLGHKVGQAVYKHAAELIEGRNRHEIADARSGGDGDPSEGEPSGATERDRSGRGSSGSSTSESGLALGLEAARNPVSGAMIELSLALPSAQSIMLDVMDVNGRRVASIAQGVFPAGRTELRWLRSGASNSPGLYFLRLSTRSQKLTRRLVAVP